MYTYNQKGRGSVKMPVADSTTTFLQFPYVLQTNQKGGMHLQQFTQKQTPQHVNKQQSLIKDYVNWLKNLVHDLQQF